MRACPHVNKVVQVNVSRSIAHSPATKVWFNQKIFNDHPVFNGRQLCLTARSEAAKLRLKLPYDDGRLMRDLVMHGMRW